MASTFSTDLYTGGYRVAQAPHGTTAPQFFWNLKEDMVEQGFRILGSSDGTNFVNDGATDGADTYGSGGEYDLWIDATDAAVANGNYGSWIRIATPEDATHYREWLLMMYGGTIGGVTGNSWRMELSRDGDGFVTGAAAGAPPTAADGISPGAITPESRTGFAAGTDNYVWENTLDNGYYWFVGDATQNYDWLACVFFRRRLSAAMGCLKLQYTTVAPYGLADEDPFLYIHALETDNTSPTNWNEKWLTCIDDDDSEENAVGSGRSAASGAGAFASYGYGTGHASEGLYGVALTVPVMLGDNSEWSDSGIDAGIQFPFYDNVVGVPVVRVSGSTTFNFRKGVIQSPSIVLSSSYGEDVGIVVGIDIDVVDSRVSRWMFGGFSFPWSIGKNGCYL